MVSVQICVVIDGFGGLYVIVIVSVHAFPDAQINCYLLTLHPPNFQSNRVGSCRCKAAFGP